MPAFYNEIIKDYYNNIEENADMPFPNEESLRICIPENQVFSLGAGSKLAAYMEDFSDPDFLDSTPSIIKINFSNDLGSALVLAEHIPQVLIESCIFKIRNYLRQYGNKEYTLNKLLVQFRGKEPSLRDILNKILARPLDCYRIITEGGEFSYLFWSHFCALLKNDIQKKFRLSTDNAALQAVCIIETLNGYYKSVAARNREKELALKKLELNLAKPPYIFTLDKIIKFTNTNGTLLLKYFTREDLTERIKLLSSVTNKNRLPELLVFKDQKNELYFVMKNMVLLLCSRLIMENRNNLRQAVLKHWFSLIKNYQNEAAMENDVDFEKTLYNFTGKICPILNIILKNPKLYLIYEEHVEKKGFNHSTRFFDRESLLPYSVLFSIKRKEILEDIHLFLPFWYSIPFIVSIASYFQRLGRKTEFNELSISAKQSLAHPLINQKPASIYYPEIFEYKMKRLKY